MSLEQRLETLKARHTNLEAKIQRELSRPHPDDIEVTALKKEKLRIKDKIAVMAAH